MFRVLVIILALVSGVLGEKLSGFSIKNESSEPKRLEITYENSSLIIELPTQKTIIFYQYDKEQQKIHSQFLIKNKIESDDTAPWISYSIMKEGDIGTIIVGDPTLNLNLEKRNSDNIVLLRTKNRGFLINLLK